MQTQALEGYAYASSDAVHHSADNPGGSVDEIRDDRVSGWCMDPLAPGEPVTLELRVQHYVLAEFPTEVPRRDIAKYYGVETDCGFSFEFADIPAERAGDILARCEDRLLKLPNEPAELHVTVKRKTVELPRWDGLIPRLDNRHLLSFLQARHASDSIGWFDATWYREENPEVREFRLDPFQHYRDRGFKEGRPPNQTIKTELGSVGIRPLNPKAGPQARIVALIAQSGLFDAGWYSEQYDVEREKAIAHYVSTGAFLGYDPSPFFCSLDYLKANTAAAKGGFNPLAHLILEGFSKGLDGTKTLSDVRLTARDWLKGI